MSIDPLSDEKIVDSWHTNASSWTSAVRERRIATRNLVTNKAITDAILGRSGCGANRNARAHRQHESDRGRGGCVRNCGRGRPTDRSGAENRSRVLLFAARMGAAGLIALNGCESPPPPTPLPPDSFAFAVFGDGPYDPRDAGPYRRVLRDVARSNVQWLIHVGDILWFPCSDEFYRKRRQDLDRAGYPVIYTPGDNEWTDCWDSQAGGYEPLDRLASLRRIFFSAPARSLGVKSLPLRSQASDSGFAEFPENALWTRGGFVFATIHVVGSDNGLEQFPGRGAANDAEVQRRIAAARAWLDTAFATAKRDSAQGIVLAIHADMGLSHKSTAPGGYGELKAQLLAHVAAFHGEVVLIHGDSHIQRVDHPLTGPDGGPLRNFTRLETFGSPDIGWIRVVVDTAAGQITSYEPRRMRGWW
jgi:hypothetical protein